MLTTNDGGENECTEDHKMAESTRSAAATGEETKDEQVDDGDLFSDLKEDPKADRNEQGEAGRSKQTDGEDGRSFGNDLLVESFETEFVVRRCWSGIGTTKSSSFDTERYSRKKLRSSFDRDLDFLKLDLLSLLQGDLLSLE